MYCTYGVECGRKLKLHLLKRKGKKEEETLEKDLTTSELI